MSEKDHRLDDYFVEYKDIVFRNLLLFVDFHTAEDLCQETFIRLAEEIESRNRPYEPTELLKWLFVVSENMARDYLKKGGQSRTIIGLPETVLEIPDRRADVERIAEEHEASRKRIRILERLKLEKRDWYDALILRYVANMSDKEISRGKEKQKCTIGKWRQRGRIQLAEWYDEEDP